MVSSVGLPSGLHLLLCKKLVAVSWAGVMDPEPAVWVWGAARGIDHRNNSFNFLRVILK